MHNCVKCVLVLVHINCVQYIFQLTIYLGHLDVYIAVKCGDSGSKLFRGKRRLLCHEQLSF